MPKQTNKIKVYTCILKTKCIKPRHIKVCSKRTNEQSRSTLQMNSQLSSWFSQVLNDFCFLYQAVQASLLWQYEDIHFPLSYIYT